MSTKRKTPSQHGNMKSREFQTEAERDSGFSDAGSEHFSTMETTDSEDSPGPVRPSSQAASPKGTSSKPGAQLTVVGGSYSNLSPMIIMNNMVLKQPGDPPPALKPWRFNPAVEVVQPVVQQPQVVFLQPVVSRQTSSTSKTSNKHRRSKKYLPILKSYPKIAPRDSSSSSSSSGRGTASSVSSGSSSPSDRSGQSERSTKEKSQRSHGSGIQNMSSTLPPMLQNQLSLPSTQTTNSGISKDSPTGLARSSELATHPSLSLSSNPNKHPLQVQQTDQESISGAQLDSEGDDDVRRKRFCNTYNILSKSGLLDITLRTKELLRQNKRTQSDIERLKEQTDLFLQALHSGDASVGVKLQAILQAEDKEREKEKREVKTD